MMAISALQAIDNHRYFYFGFESHPTDKEPYQATPITAYSDNLTQWVTISKLDELDGLRDGFVKKINNIYYVIGTGGFYKTADFISFDKLGYINNSESWKNIWAPEIFQDKSGQYHIIFCAGDASKGILDVFVTDFDPSNETIGKKNTQVSFYDGALTNSYRIDPDITLIDGVYFLTLGGNYLFSSNNYLGPYQKFPTNFAPTPQKYSSNDSNISGWVEGPQLFEDGDSVRLYADQTDGNGLVFRSAVKGDMFNWSDTTKTHAQFKMRHGSILVNEKVSAQVPVEVDDAPKFDSKVLIQGTHTDQWVPLTCFMRNSFQVQYENNQTNQLQFVAYDDGSPSFTLVSNEATIIFNGNLYIIKNVEQDMTGSNLFTVTALQYVNSEISRVFQRNIKSGTLTYTVDAVLDFFLNDKIANPFGFSYHVFGDFDKQQIENLGGCSGKDMISKITETWPGTIVYPNGKRLDVYSIDAFKKDYGRRIVYTYNTSNIKLVEDSTGIINQVKCIGATVTTDTTNDTSEDTGGISVQDGYVQMESGADHTAEFQADAKKYLGVPYVWGGAGGARGGNPFSGMDCSSYVSQVYKDFGINIPAQTVAMESSFREIPYSEAKAGDVGFYGPHGGTHHICLLLDHNTMIYEPEPGQSCKTALVSSYAPSWYGRNDAMQSKINTKKVEMAPTETVTITDSYSSSSDSSSTTEQYYFQPFIISDQQSIDNWGLHPGSDIQDDRFKDPEAMKKYGMKQLVPDPTITVEIVGDDNSMPIPGEIRTLTIPDKKVLMGETDTQSAYNTTVTAVGYTWYPFDANQVTDVTYDNLQASILHARTAMSSDLRRIEQLANAALDRMPQVFYANQDPSANQAVKNGAIWVKPIIDKTNSTSNATITNSDKKTGGET
ncbi:MAG: phage tail protein [Ruminococcus flavefaciens]|nr:phage tail protein [Ruminococcus flavefaciens]